MDDGRPRPGQLHDDELRRRWEQAPHQIQIPDPFDLQAFCDAIATHRNRPIQLPPFHGDEPDAPSGLWVQGDDTDYIYFERDTTRLHQQHIVLHELGHILAGHLADPAASASYRESYLPNLDPEMLKRILGRTNYSAEQEQEAEWFARDVGRRVNAQSGATSADDDAIKRAQSALGSRW